MAQAALILLEVLVISMVEQGGNQLMVQQLAPDYFSLLVVQVVSVAVAAAPAEQSLVLKLAVVAKAAMA
jgi:hypothetical protein